MMSMGKSFQNIDMMAMMDKIGRDCTNIIGEMMGEDIYITIENYINDRDTHDKQDKDANIMDPAMYVINLGPSTIALESDLPDEQMLDMSQYILRNSNIKNVICSNKYNQYDVKLVGDSVHYQDYNDDSINESDYYNDDSNYHNDDY